MLLLWMLACGPKIASERMQVTHDLPPSRAELGEQRDEMVPMSDGTRLYTRIWLPEGEGPFPTVFTRCPYPMDGRLDRLCALFNRYGYACAWQKTRGQGQSEGDWTPMLHERSDGQDALAWLVEQPWQDGNIGLFGESYLAATQWWVADVLPEEVKTLVPQIFGPDGYDTAYRGGMFRHDIATAWMALTPGRGLRPFAGPKYAAALKRRPRREMDLAASGMALPWFRDWLDAERSAPFWQAPLTRLAATMPTRATVPMLFIGGWSDTFIGPQLDAWQTLATQQDSALVVGPWDHLGRVASDVPLAGVMDPEHGTGEHYGLWQRKLDWFDQHLRGAEPRWGAGTWTYITGGERWAVSESWPPATHADRWHMAPGNAAGCHAVLTRGRTTGEAQWTYDPADPTPSLGGAGLLGGALPLFGSVAPGLRDQGTLCEDRADMLGWEGAALAQATVLAGPITAELTVSTDTADAAVNLRVLERRADGTLLHLREDIRALSFRAGDDAKVATTPGEPVTLRLETWPLHHELQAGSRVVVQLASASFPKFEAHANTAEPWTEAVQTVPATLTVDLGRSWVSLPVVTD